MLPYQAVAMDYGGYQRQGGGGNMGMGAFGGPAFTHSWLVPPQDLCGVPYKQMGQQHPNSVMHPQQSIEPGHVLDRFSTSLYLSIIYLLLFSCLFGGKNWS